MTRHSLVAAQSRMLITEITAHNFTRSTIQVELRKRHNQNIEVIMRTNTIVIKTRRCHRCCSRALSRTGF